MKGVQIWVIRRQGAGLDYVTLTLCLAYRQGRVVASVFIGISRGG